MKNQLITKRKLQRGIMQYGLIALAILVIGGYFGFKNYTEYQDTHAAFDQEAVTLADLKGTEEKANLDYITLKKDFDTQNSGVNQSIDQILPPSEDFTFLARQLDSYFNGTTPTDSAIFLSDLRFSPPLVDQTHEFGILPFSMNISGSENGFVNFLKYVEGSGDLNDKSRLLSINTMNLSYNNSDATNTTTAVNEDGTPVVTTAPQTNISATLNMNSYFQKPADAVTPAAL